MESKNDIQKQELMDMFGMYRPTDAEWDAIDHELKEDANKSLSERSNLPSGLFVAAMLENHFEEYLQKALIQSDEREFLALLKEGCYGFNKETSGFDLIIHLQDVRERVCKYVAGETAKPSFRRSLYIQTGNAITDGIDNLIKSYRQPDTGSGNDEIKLSLRQVALLFIYRDKTIGRGKEADNIAQQYGYKSGEKLYKHYIKYLRTCDRTGVEGRAIKPFIEDILAITPYLNSQQQAQAETELETISNKIQDWS